MSATGQSRRVRGGGIGAGPKLEYLFALACVSLFGASSALAGDTWQSWPELAVYKQLNERSRAFFDAAYALGKESDSVKSVDVAAFLDVSLKPIVPKRRQVLSEDWQRNRYLWARIGYDRIFEATDSAGAEVVENRGVIALYGRVPLPAEIWLETRSRADFRRIGDDSSNRYRFRLDVSRELTVRDHAVAPYFNFEWFYDTRYDELARTLATIGTEVTATDHFRYEIYIARQSDRVPEESGFRALGIVLKWYY